MTQHDFRLPKLAVLQEIYPAYKNEANTISLDYFNRLASVVEQALSIESIQNVDVISTEVIELRVAELYARNLDKYRYLMTAAFEGLRPGDTSGFTQVVLALNSITAMLTGLRVFAKHHLPESIKEQKRFAMDVRLEFYQEEVARRFSETLWQHGCRDILFSASKGGFYVDNF